MEDFGLMAEVTIGDVTLNTGVHGDCLILEQPSDDQENKLYNFDLVYISGEANLRELHAWLGVALDRLDSERRSDICG